MRDPGLVRSTWFPWLFTTGQGVACNAPRGDANIVLLIFGWGVFICAGMVAPDLLARALWGVDDDQALPPAGENTAKAEPSA
ncbi:hypothetical protein [Streptomyces chrestomyceticus]|uniref:hypothetical protein n=1 Tax=Streptomyces chrestomyceticus TaxID=68185 RepID=UPI0019D16428|nr:hypothetical protein [Streptomyces chrestomyceticus]